MNPKRINVLGASGCGATTVGRALAVALSIPHFDCDDYYHEPTDPPFHRARSPVVRHAMLTTDVQRHQSWVLSGGVAGWKPEPRLDFTCVVFLWVPAPVRIERLRRREFERFGPRILAGGDMHQAHEAFIEWASHYDAGDVEGKTLARHEAYLTSLCCQVLQFRAALSVAAMTSATLNALGRG